MLIEIIFIHMNLLLITIIMNAAEEKFRKYFKMKLYEKNNLRVSENFIIYSFLLFNFGIKKNFGDFYPIFIRMKTKVLTALYKGILASLSSSHTIIFCFQLSIKAVFKFFFLL